MKLQQLTNFLNHFLRSDDSTLTINHAIDFDVLDKNVFYEQCNLRKTPIKKLILRGDGCVSQWVSFLTNQDNAVQELCLEGLKIEEMRVLKPALEHKNCKVEVLSIANSELELLELVLEELKTAIKQRKAEERRIAMPLPIDFIQQSGKPKPKRNGFMWTHSTPETWLEHKAWLEKKRQLNNYSLLATKFSK